jgi:drug/metabolite transporter (DMT)-like permease
MDARSPTLRGFAQPVLMPGLFVVLWSTGFIMSKLGLPYAEPLTFLALRFLLVLAIMVPVALATDVRWPHGMMVLHVAFVGVLVQTGYLAGIYIAIRRGVPAGLAALIVGAQPLLTASLSARMTGEQVAGRQWLGLAIGFAGIALVMVDRLAFGGTDAIGLSMCILATLAITIGSLHQKRHCAGVDLRSGAVIQYTAALVPLVILAPLTESLAVDWTVPFIISMAWLVLVLSIGAISLYYVLIRRGAAASVASMFYLVPPTTALMGYVLFHETLSLITVLGMVLAALGVALVNKSG